MPLVLDGTTGFSGGGGVATSTALGSSALFTNSTGTNLVAIGYQAGYFTTAGPNVFVGSQAGYTNSTGTSNIGIGYQALYSNTTGSNNLAIGYQAGYSNTTGDIEAFGYQALYANTTGIRLTAVGYSALGANSTGGYNTAVGFQALALNTTASNNTAVGVQAGYTNTTSGYNVFVGYRAGYTSNATAVPNAGNVCVGGNAGSSLTTGAGNIFIGSDGSNAAGGAGSGVTTGSNNVIIGGNTGSAAPISATGSNYIVLADGAGNVRQYMNGSGQASWGSPMIDGFLNLKWAGQTYVGFVMNNTDAAGSSSDIRFKNNGTTVGEIASTSSTTSYNTSSDYRLKENVQSMTGALTTISKLKPCTYTWKNSGVASQGFIAHELQEVVPDCVTGEKDALNEDGSIKPQGIDTSFLVATLTAAIKELKTLVDAQSALITGQAAEIVALKAKVGL